jgi:hypothetical protein
MNTGIGSLVARALGLADELAQMRAQLDAMAAERQAAIASWDEERERAQREGKRVVELKARLAGLDFYLCDLPPQETEVDWTKDDAKTLAAFLDGPVGERLLKHLTNRLSDYERMAIFYSRAADAALLCKRAHGFRDCRGELLRLSAAGPSPAETEPPADALPAELENLRA